MNGPSPWLIRHLDHLPKDGDVLDLAAGRGRHAQPLLDRGCRLWAVDRDSAALASWQPHPRLRRLAWDVERHGLPAGLKVDAMLIFLFLHRPLFATLAAHLKPGGLLVHETFHVRNRREHGRPGREQFCWQQGEAGSFFERCGFHVIHCEDGVESDGRWVTRLVAVRE